MYGVSVTPDDPANYQGGQILVIGISGVICGYEFGIWSQVAGDGQPANQACGYVARSSFWTFPEPGPAPSPAAITGGVLLEEVFADPPNDDFSLAFYARPSVAAQDAALLVPFIERCHRFAFDFIGLEGPINSAFGMTNDSSVMLADPLLRNGIPGQASVGNAEDLPSLAVAIVNRAVAFFS